MTSQVLAILASAGLVTAGVAASAPATRSSAALPSISSVTTLQSASLGKPKDDCDKDKDQDGDKDKCGAAVPPGGEGGAAGGAAGGGGIGGTVALTGLVVAIGAGGVALAAKKKSGG